jgi:hypothetical protein
MTLAQMAVHVRNQLNLSSASSYERIKDVIRERYAWVLGDLGVRLAALTQATANASIGDRDVAFTGHKIYNVYITTGLVKLDEQSYDQLMNVVAGADPPTAYAVVGTTATTVTIRLNTTPGSTFGLTADVLGDVDAYALADNDAPVFSAYYHDLLVHGALAAELRKMEKPALADKQEELFQARVAGLKTVVGGTL